MIKKFNSFIKENLDFGHYVEKNMEDENINRLILPFLKDYKKDLKISNIVNLLDENIKKEIKSTIDNYLSNGLSSGDSVNVSAIVESSGKGVFDTFLKSISAMSISNSLKKKDKKGFILFFNTDIVENTLIEQVFKRFKSLSYYLEKLNIESGEVFLFYGINDDLNIEYGLYVNENKFTIGYFKLNSSTFNSIKQNNLKPLSILKDNILDLSFDNIKDMLKITKDIDSIPILDFKKRSYININKSNIKFGYYGIGSWKNGELSQQDVLMYKDIIKNWILNSKWKDKILYKVYPSDFWVIVELKIK